MSPHTSPLDAATPWALRWALNIVVAFALVVGLAFAWDAFAAEPWAVCRVIGWSVPATVALVELSGFLLLFTPRRALGVALIVLGLVVEAAPHSLLPDWVGTRCPALAESE